MKGFDPETGPLFHRSSDEHAPGTSGESEETFGLKEFLRMLEEMRDDEEARIKGLDSLFLDPVPEVDDVAGWIAYEQKMRTIERIANYAEIHGEVLNEIERRIAEKLMQRPVRPETD